MSPCSRNHARNLVFGKSTSFEETSGGLIGTFKVNHANLGDELLDDLRHGYLRGMSVGFTTSHAGRGADGVREVRVAHLHEVSVVGIPAYDKAALLALRSAQLLAPFAARPDVNLDPLPPIPWGR